jgi:transcriptional regulator with XRE-family HTH domain
MRTLRGLGLRETARRIGVSATFISRVENQNALPGEDVISKLAVLLDDDFDVLMQLAGRVARDVEAVVKADIAMPALVRRMRDQGISADALLRMLDKGNNHE